MLFKDRKHAGIKLAPALKKYKHNKDTIILGLPRGGVVVAYEIAKENLLPLDVICPRKIGAPFNPELAIGATTETGESILNESFISQLGISPQYIQQEIDKEKAQAQRRLHLFRSQRPPRNLRNKIVILVDDGLATGATMKAAIQSVKAEGASFVIVAIPVAPKDTLEEIQQEVDEIYCLNTPTYFEAIGQFYDNFTQVEDDEVIHLLQLQFQSSLDFNPFQKDLESKEIVINLNKAGNVQGILSLPKDAKTLVLFAHGSGSGRLSPRNQAVAKILQKSGLATLLMDLLTPEEEFLDKTTGEFRFNISFLAERLIEVTDWARRNNEIKNLKIAFFGASTGAAAALVAAAALGKNCISSIVSRGGRPDLAGIALAKVQVPTLLLVGGKDEGVIELNEQAYKELLCIKKITIIPGATHLFEEQGALESVAEIAAEWFIKYN